MRLRKQKKVVAVTLATAIAVSAISASASAVSYDLADGDVTIDQDADRGAFSYQGDGNRTYVNEDKEDDGKIIIKQDDKDTPTENTVTVKEGVEKTDNADGSEGRDVDIVIDGVNADTSKTGESTVTVGEGANVDLTVKDSTLTTGDNGIDIGKNLDRKDENDENKDTKVDLTLEDTTINQTNKNSAGLDVRQGSDVDLTLKGDNVIDGSAAVDSATKEAESKGKKLTDSNINVEGIRVGGEVASDFSGAEKDAHLTIKGDKEETSDTTEETTGGSLTIKDTTTGMVIAGGSDEEDSSVTITDGADVTIQDTHVSGSTQSGRGVTQHGDLTLDGGSSLTIDGSHVGEDGKTHENGGIGIASWNDIIVKAKSKLNIKNTKTGIYGHQGASTSLTTEDSTLNITNSDAELRAKKAALQKALADAIEACTGTKVDPASLTLTDEDVSFPKENISANKDVLNRTYVYTASDGKKYTFTYNFVYNDKPSSVSGAGYKGAGYFMDGIHVGTEEIVADADGKTDHKSTLIESGVFVSGNATTDANGAYTTITKDSPLYGLGVDFKTAPKNAVAGSIKYDDTGRIIEYQTTDGKTIKLSYESVEVPDSNLPSYAPVDGKTNINSKSFTRVTWEAWNLGEIHNEEQADDQWTLSSGKDESGSLTYTIVDKKNNVTYDDLVRVGSNSYTKTVTDENGVKTTYTVTVEPGSLSESRALTELAERYGVDAAAITVKDGVASFTRDGKQYQVGYGSQLKIETVLTTEGTVTTDADQADLLEKIQQMQKDLQDGEILDVGGYQVTISTSKDEIIEILHKVGETTDFTRLTREELKALLEKEKAEADAAGKSYTGDMDVSHPEYSNKNLYGKPNNSLYDSFRKTYLSYDGNYIQHLELNATTKADLLKDADGNVSQTDCVLVDKKLEYSDDLDKLIDSQGTSVVNLQDKIGYDIPMDRYEYARTSFSDGDKLNWNVRNNHPTASTYYKVSGTVAYNQYKPADGTSDLTKEQAEALLKQLQAEGYADASIVTFYTTEHEHQQTSANASYRIYLNKSELVSYGYLSYDSNTCANAHNWNQEMYGLKNKVFNPDAYCGGYDLGLTGFRQVEDGTFVAQGKKTITVSRILPATTLTNNHLTITDSAQKADTGSGVSGRYNYTTTVSGSRVNYSALGTATHETWKEAAQQTTERTGEQGDGTLSYTYRSTQDASVDAESAHKEETVVRHGTADYEYTYTASKDEVEITTDSRTETTTPETPETPDTPVSPEGPTTPPVQDATPDDAETPVTPGNPANPSVQDATPDTVAALPKTGVNWTAALAMALSGMALTVAGAFTSLFAKSKH